MSPQRREKGACPSVQRARVAYPVVAAGFVPDAGASAFVTRHYAALPVLAHSSGADDLVVFIVAATVAVLFWVRSRRKEAEEPPHGENQE